MVSDILARRRWLAASMGRMLGAVLLAPSSEVHPRVAHDRCGVVSLLGRGPAHHVVDAATR